MRDLENADQIYDALTIIVFLLDDTGLHINAY